MNHNQAPQYSTQIPPRIPVPEAKNVPPATAGRHAVEAVERAIGYDLQVDQIEQTEEQAHKIRAEKVHPAEKGFIGRKIARRLGRLMTFNEVRFLDYAKGQVSTKESEKEMGESEKEISQMYLRRFRENLQSQDIDSIGSMYLSVYCHKAPKWFQEVKRKQDPDSSWKDWLSTNASDAYVMNFLQWHISEIEQQHTDPETRQKIVEISQQYKADVAKAAKNWLHEDAAQASDKVDGIEIYKGDIFDTVVRGSEGYHRLGSRSIVVSSLSPKIISHELTHAVGFGDDKPRWRMEAEVEHITHSLLYGEPEIMDPSKRTVGSENGDYVSERSLYAAILTEGLEVVPAQLATRAASEKLDSQTAKKMLEVAVNKAWRHYLPENTSVFNLIDKHIMRLEQIAVEEGKSWREVIESSVTQALSDLRERPELIFGERKHTEVRDVAPRSTFTSEHYAKAFQGVIHTMMKKGLSKGGATTSSRPTGVSQKKAPSHYSATVEATVQQDIGTLREQGFSDKKIYRELARKYHPDANSGTSDRYKLGYLSDWHNKISREKAKTDKK
jgi:hypothetical protein